MKDDRLEKEFEEYFKGVNTPDDITGDAKKYVKPKYKFLPKFVKFASVAASFVLVCAVALTIILTKNFNSAPDDNSATEDNSTTDPSDSENTVIYYTDAELETENKSAYSIYSLDRSLKFIQNFAVANGSSVKSCSAAYRNGQLALVKAEIDVFHNLYRDETSVYVEFTDARTVYSPLSGYGKGKRQNYCGAEYYLTRETGDNGEPQFKLLVAQNNVKYYFNVRSADENAYKKYLQIVVN